MADPIKKLAELFSKFPTVGHRTASRFVFYLMKLPKENIDELTSAILELKNKIKFCSFCFNPSESSDLCSICQNSLRNKQLLCVVDKEADLMSIEKTKKYNGLYFILGGANSLRIQELLDRVKAPAKFEEIIIATNPTPEGRATSMLIEKALREIQPKNFSAEGRPASGWKITHLAQGLPFGGELEYADQETLESALEGRK
ncbi:MAG: recombination protein RecR [Candidatus Staskawiczbacteria bacterium]|nr:recombination protein RecR [Candidatus Staskawiczbacteria bacterium]